MSRGLNAAALVGRRRRAWITAALAGLSTACAQTPPAAPDGAPPGRTKPPPPPPEVRSFRVRVLADGDYRRAHVDWERHVTRVFDRANQDIGPRFGVVLIPESAPWSAQPATHLAAALSRLIDDTPADGADFVVGLVTSLPALPSGPTVFRDLGIARRFGRHLVVRSGTRLTNAEDDGDRSADDAVAREATVLLHEWVHALGAPHRAKPGGLMYPVAAGAVRFDDATDALIRVSVRHLPARGPEARTAWWNAVGQVLAATEGWATDRNPAIAVGPAATGTTARAQEADDLILIALDDQAAAAFREIRSLLFRYPTERPLLRATCFIGSRGAASSTTTWSACTRWADRDPDNPLPLVWLATAQVSADHEPQARASLAAAVERLEPSGDPYWFQIARVHQSMDELSDAEQAALRAPETKGRQAILDWARVRRLRYGVPAGSVEPTDEPAYLRALVAGHRALDRDDFATAQSILQGINKSLQSAAGSTTLACRVEMTRGAFARARRLCDRALSGAPDTSYARLLAGLIHAFFGEARGAIADLERAIAIDPELVGPRAALATVRARTGR